VNTDLWRRIAALSERMEALESIERRPSLWTRDGNDISYDDGSVGILVNQTIKTSADNGFLRVLGSTVFGRGASVSLTGQNRTTGAGRTSVQIGGASGTNGATQGAFSVEAFQGSTTETTVFRVMVDGKVAAGNITPTAPLDIAGNGIRIRTARTPASAGAAGDAGDICWDANFIYVCVATNTWKRVGIATW
jgi:hypothetical protein